MTSVKVTLLYFHGCPNWQETETRVREALRLVGAPPSLLELVRVPTVDAAERLRFRGSPTVLIDGEDPFANASAPVGLSYGCSRRPRGCAGPRPSRSSSRRCRFACAGSTPEGDTWPG